MAVEEISRRWKVRPPGPRAMQELMTAREQGRRDSIGVYDLRSESDRETESDSDRETLRKRRRILGRKRESPKETANVTVREDEGKLVARREGGSKSKKEKERERERLII